MIVTFVESDVVLGVDTHELLLVPSAVRPARRRFTLGSTHMVRVQRREEEDGFGL